MGILKLLDWEDFLSKRGLRKNEKTFFFFFFLFILFTKIRLISKPNEKKNLYSSPPKGK